MYKHILAFGTLTVILFTGCATTSPKPFNNTINNQSFYSGKSDIDTPNKSFSYCWKKHCGKNGHWLNKDSQFTRYEGNYIRPRFEFDAGAKISAKQFREKAAIALKAAKEEIHSKGNGFQSGQKILLTTNGSSNYGFEGFCIKPAEEGSVDVEKGSDEAYFWNLKHCYSPLYKNRKIIGWKEYDQSVCALYERKKGKRYKFREGVSCWDLGEYTPKVAARTGYVTPVEFVDLITTFNKKFAEELRKQGGGE